MNLFSRVAIVATALLATVSTASADGAWFTKYAAHQTQSGVTINAFYGAVLTVQLPKGIKKRILEVDASLIESSNIATAIGIHVRVNGFMMEPQSGMVVDNCTVSTVSCTTQGHFWMDLDAAELLAPGTFIGVPLNIELYGAKSSPAGTVTGIATIDAHMNRK